MMIMTLQTPSWRTMFRHSSTHRRRFAPSLLLFSLFIRGCRPVGTQVAAHLPNSHRDPFALLFDLLQGRTGRRGGRVKGIARRSDLKDGVSPPPARFISASLGGRSASQSFPRSGLLLQQ